MNRSYTPVGNVVTKSVYRGSTPNDVWPAQSYQITKASSRTNTDFTPAGEITEPPPDGCTEHENCVGHIRRVGTVLILPPEDSASKYGLVSDNMRLAMNLSSGLIDMHQYKAGISKSLRGKRGVLRGGATSFVVDGSLRMVICPDPRRAINEITVPGDVARNMLVPTIGKGGSVTYSELQEGMYLIVIRPPCLGPGSCQPMRVVIEEGLTCLGFPTLACAPYHADFDGDEVQGYCVTTPSAVEECRMWMGSVTRSYSVSQLVREMKTLGHDYPREVLEPFVMDCATLTYADVMKGDLKLNCLHKATGLKESHCATFVKQARSTATLWDRFTKSVDVMNGKISKQSQQSRIGYVCRQAKVASVNYPRGAIAHAVDSGPTYRWTSGPGRVPELIGDTYGCVLMRLISGLCQTLMQEMLTTKSGSYNSNAMSPIHCFLTGEGRAIMIFERAHGSSDSHEDSGEEERKGSPLTKSEPVVVCVDTPTEGKNEYIERVDSGMKLVMTNSVGVMVACGISGDHLREVCCAAAHFIACCSGRTLTDSSKGTFVTMITDAVGRRQKGLVLDQKCVGTDDMRWLYVCHSVYYSPSHPCLPKNLDKRMVPTTLPERMLFANHCVESSLAAVMGNGLGRSVHPRPWTAS